MRHLSLPSAQACATGEKLKCAQPQPQEADPLQVRNPSHSCHLSIYLHLPIRLSIYLAILSIVLIYLIQTIFYLSVHLDSPHTISALYSLRLHRA